MPSVGKPLPHDSAAGHVTGQALYLDDLRTFDGELHVGFVGSPVASGELFAVDIAPALAVPGVVACYTAADVAGQAGLKNGSLVREIEHLLKQRLLIIRRFRVIMVIKPGFADCTHTGLTRHGTQFVVGVWTPVTGVMRMDATG